MDLEGKLLLRLFVQPAPDVKLFIVSVGLSIALANPEKLQCQSLTSSLWLDRTSFQTIHNTCNAVEELLLVWNTFCINVTISKSDKLTTGQIILFLSCYFVFSPLIRNLNWIKNKKAKGGKDRRKSRSTFKDACKLSSYYISIATVAN